MDRGIIGSALIVAEGGGIIADHTLLRQSVRYYSLYWDRVVIPTLSFFRMVIPEEDILIESGVIERPIVQFNGSFNDDNAAEVETLIQSIAARELINTDPTTDWVFHQHGDRLLIPPEFAELKRALRFNLINALPVPDNTTPIVDILEFKLRRADELNALHAAINEVYIQVLKSPDIALSNHEALRELDDTINNINTVSNEKWDIKTKFDVTASFNIDGTSIGLGSAGGAVVDKLSGGLTFPIGTIAGGLASMLKLKVSYGLSFKPAENCSKFTYISKAHKAKII